MLSSPLYTCRITLLRWLRQGQSDGYMEPLPHQRGKYWFSEHDGVIKWQHFPRYWPFVRGIHRSPVKSPHKGQRRGALMFSLICASINRWVNNGEAGDFRRCRTHYDVIVMKLTDVELAIRLWITNISYCVESVLQGLFVDWMCATDDTNYQITHL